MFPSHDRNKISGGGGSGSSSGLRIKATRTSDNARLGTATPTLTVDGQLNVTGLTSGTTYKVTAAIRFSTDNDLAELRYYVGPLTYATMANSDFCTHTASMIDSTYPVHITTGDIAPENSLTAGSLGVSYVSVTGEVTVPSGENSIGVYWDSAVDTHTVSILEGSSLVVEGV